jgi:hypothetical protein
MILAIGRHGKDLHEFRKIKDNHKDIDSFMFSFRIYFLFPSFPSIDRGNFQSRCRREFGKGEGIGGKGSGARQSHG